MLVRACLRQAGPLPSGASSPSRALAKLVFANQFGIIIMSFPAVRDQFGMPGSEGRRPHSGLSPEEQLQLSFLAVMAPLPVEIPWPLEIAARSSALFPPRDSMSLGAASRGAPPSERVDVSRRGDQRTMGRLNGAPPPSPPLRSHPARHIPSRHPPPSPPGGAHLDQSMSGWPSRVATDSGMSVGEIASTWSGRLDAPGHRLDDHGRYFHTDAAGTPANDVSNSDVSNSDVSNSRWWDEGTVAPQRPAPSPGRDDGDRGNGSEVRTVMIRNLPPGLHQRQLLSELDEEGFHNTYCSVHMPTNLSTSQNKGFAFVNFVAEEHALHLMNAWNGTHRFGMQMDQMPLNLAPSWSQDSSRHHLLMQSKFFRIKSHAFRPFVTSDA